nr:MAG TPA: hypothetical protein [Caudoviricetes sp.]
MTLQKRQACQKTLFQVYLQDVAVNRQQPEKLLRLSVLMFWKSLKQNKIRRAACEMIERS